MHYYENKVDNCINNIWNDKSSIQKEKSESRQKKGTTNAQEVHISYKKRKHQERKKT